MSVKKKIGAAILGLGSVAGIAALSTPAAATALGWTANEMIYNTHRATQMSASTINQDTLAQWVQTFTTWILGIAIVLFVLKVVLTAVDRLVFDGSGNDKTLKAGGTGKGASNGNGGGILTQIPLIGAYDSSMAWKDIFIHFGKNLAIVAGAWVIVQIVTGVILFVFQAMTQSVAK